MEETPEVKEPDAVRPRLETAPSQGQAIGGMTFPPSLPPPPSEPKPLIDSAAAHFGDEPDSVMVVNAVSALLTQGHKELNLKEQRWKTPEGKAMIRSGYAKELQSLVTNTKAWIPEDLERSRELRTSVPDRILRPRPVLTLRHDDEGVEEVKCRCTLQGFKDPDILDLVRQGRTASPTLSTNGRGLILQLIASCRFHMAIGDVRSAFLMADREDTDRMVRSMSPCRRTT